MSVTQIYGSPAGSSTDTVWLRVPADPAYLAVLRTASAGLAARLDLTLDEIEDLRIAVDEACALLLKSDAPHACIEAEFCLTDEALEISVSGPATSVPQQSSFAWAVLEALVGEVQTGQGAQGSWIRLRHARTRRSG